MIRLNRIEALLGVQHGSLVRYLMEVGLDSEFLHHITSRKMNIARMDHEIGGWMALHHLMLIYAIVRLRQPRAIVETGVGPGSSAAFILRALQRNEAGTLVSIDLPQHDTEDYPRLGRRPDVYVPTGESAGWLIHPGSRGRWDLRLGDAKTLLPQVLSEFEEIDIFLHDSLHTYEHMYFEYSEAIRALSTGGLLLSDDVNVQWSLAFVDICKEKDIPFVILDEQLGIAIPRSSKRTEKILGGLDCGTNDFPSSIPRTATARD